MKTKLFSLLFAILASIGVMSAWDYEHIQIDELYYSLDATTRTAEVQGGHSAYKNLTSVIIPAQVVYNDVEYAVTGIGHDAFGGCESLISVSIPNSVTNIEQGAFWQCRNLTTVNISNSVIRIGDWAFSGCRSLISVTIPNSVTSIGQGVFTYCSSLASIDVESESQYFCSYEGVLFNKDRTILVQYPGGKQGAYTIPNTVSSVVSGAFTGCDNLTSLTIPSNVIDFPCHYGVGGEKLKSIILNSDHIINKYSVSNFFGKQVETFTIGDNVTTIANDAFNGSKRLTTITVDENNPNYCSIDGVLFNKDKTALIRLPEGKNGAYTIPNTVTSLENYAFFFCTALTSIKIPDNVTRIGEKVFSYCAGISSINVPISVISIGEDAFKNIPLVIYYGKATGAPWGAKSINNYVSPHSYPTSIIDLTDNSIADWDNVPVEYIAKAQCSKDAIYLGLKEIKVYADATSIFILVEPDMTDITDLSLVAFDVFINTDNSDLTGGGVYIFTDNNADILLEGYLYADGAPCSYTPSVYKWWGEVGGYDWEWYDPSIEHNAYDCGGALICSEDLVGTRSQYVDGKFEIQIMRQFIPAEWDEGNFDIGFGILQNWNEVGILPCAEITEEGVIAYSKKMLVKIDNDNGIETTKKVIIDNIQYILSEEEQTAQVTAYYYSGSIEIPSSFNYQQKSYNVFGIDKQSFMPATDLKSISIPASVSQIGDSAFVNCIVLASLTCQATNPPTLGKNVFSGVDKSIPLYVPNESVPAYKAADQWNEFINILPLDANPTSIEHSEELLIPQKFIRNGLIFIVREGKTYNVQGLEVR